MRALCLYLHIHQPWRFRRYSIFDVSHNHDYFDQPDFYDKQNNERIFQKVAEKSYRPTLNLLERNLEKHPDFKFSISVTGPWLEQAVKFAPDLIHQLQHMTSTGRVEIVGETYYHSMSFFYRRDEFEDQVRRHATLIQRLFNQTPAVFRNTELAYNNDLGAWADAMNYKGVLAEGWDKVLGWRSPNFVYRPLGAKHTKLLLKNYRLSDDIAFRFSNKGWSEWPLTVEKYQNWLNMEALRGNLINLFMDFETFGEHQWADTGIFEFIDVLIDRWLGEYDNKFLTVSEACDLSDPVDEISMPQTVTWADTERDLSAWMGNDMQDEAMRVLYSLRDSVLATGNTKLIADWRRLTTSDHAYYMCTKYWNDGDVHAYFSAYDSPYDAFMYFMNVIRDLTDRIANAQKREEFEID